MVSGKEPARLPERNSCKAFLQGLQQRVPAKVQAKVPASVSARDLRL
jgi:hypothetical protein